ncbi:MAG: RNA 2',3'-cyclic phosphodiesterase [Candidatus Latescibacteria bacterium]|nr:RNA 2',3'-cyclic phosphodiesterase [Candidatus Latescibacterota bacterium]
MRTFIAVDIPDAVKQKVGVYANSLREYFDNGMKWVLPENLHLTIKFLGEVNKNDLSAVENCVSQVTSGFSSFMLELSGIGFFPSERKPRVLWIGSDEGGHTLLDAYQNLETCLETEGFDRDSKPFSPHLTIGRVRKNWKLVVPDKIPDFDPVAFEVSGFTVIKSTLTLRGPVYEKLYESNLIANP